MPALPPDTEQAFPKIAEHLGSIRMILTQHSELKPHELPAIAANIQPRIEAMVDTTLADIRDEITHALSELLAWLGKLSIKLGAEESIQYILQKTRELLPQCYDVIEESIEDFRRGLQVAVAWQREKDGRSKSGRIELLPENGS